MSHNKPAVLWTVVSLGAALIGSTYLFAPRLVATPNKKVAEMTVQPSYVMASTPAVSSGASTTTPTLAGATASASLAPLSISTAPDQFATFAVPPLGISISYSKTTGTPRLVHGGLGNICDYEITFSNLDYVDACAFTVTTVRNYIANNTAGEWHMDVGVWAKDKEELQTLPAGAPCSHPSVYSCTVIMLKSGIKALSFYDDRPEMKSYMVYHGGYLIDFRLDVYDEFSDYQNSYPDGLGPSIEKMDAPKEVLDKVSDFRELVNGVSYSRQ